MMIMRCDSAIDGNDAIDDDAIEDAMAVMMR